MLVGAVQSADAGRGGRARPERGIGHRGAVSDGEKAVARPGRRGGGHGVELGAR